MSPGVLCSIAFIVDLQKPCFCSGVFSLCCFLEAVKLFVTSRREQKGSSVPVLRVSLSAKGLVDWSLLEVASLALVTATSISSSGVPQGKTTS